jgi:aminoglycoside/choline kinase family phosphotransferase
VPPFKENIMKTRAEVIQEWLALEEPKMELGDYLQENYVQVYDVEGNYLGYDTNTIHHKQGD